MAVTISGPLNGREAGKAADRARTYRRRFRLQTTAGEDEAEVLAWATAWLPPAGDPEGDPAPRVADVGSPHPHDALSFVRVITLRDVSPRDGSAWELELEYGPFVPGDSSPLLEEPELDWGSAPYQRIADADREGRPVLNSAGDWFDPPLVRDDSRPTLTIVRNEATFSPWLAEFHRDTVNKHLFFGAAPGTVKCASITAKRARSGDVPGGTYWVVTYAFHLNRAGWTSRVLDQGFRRREPSGARRAILVDGQPAGSPVLLDGEGELLPHGDDPVFLPIDLYREMDFAGFNFPGADQAAWPDLPS